MRFEYYSDDLANLQKLSVDGTVANAIHFSHWRGNQTPAAVKADTSTEIALNVVAAQDRDRLTQGIDLVTNNHFDTDGVLSVWTMLSGKRALDLRASLIAAAEAGDFCEFSTIDAVRASIVIQGSDSPIGDAGSPLAKQLAKRSDVDDRLAYELVLPHVADVLAHTDKYQSLWRDEWNRIAVALESFADGSSHVIEDDEAGISTVMLAADIFGPAGFNPALHAAPFTAISHHAHGDVFLIVTPLDRCWAYRIDYPYYSWAETIVRPPIERRDFNPLVAELNELENNSQASWQVDSSELASAIKFSDQAGRLSASGLEPDVVAAALRKVILKTTAAPA